MDSTPALNRKKFLERSAAGVLGGFGLLGCSAAGLADEKKEIRPEDPAMKFAHQWVAHLMENMDSQLDGASRIKLMEASGRACARQGAISMAEQNKGQIDKFLSVLAGHLGKENARREGDKVTLIYKECYCPLMKSAPVRLSSTYCNCSRGWVKEMLECVTAKPVEVELLKSIKRGGDCCHFVATI
jgi:hypothetical protein